MIDTESLQKYRAVLTPRQQATAPHLVAVPCSRFTFDELAAIYNDTRVDYIVPMPMNGRRMQEYVRDYDINLDDSVVVSDGSKIPLGIGMLGYRQDRAWITRLGIRPDQRGRHLGSFLMETLLDRARRHHTRRVQLEVIKGNDPAYNLFIKFGFEPVRELLILNRPPTKPDVETHPPFPIETLSSEDARRFLQAPLSGIAGWVDEPASLLNGSDLAGFQASDQGDTKGWFVFCKTRFQVSHFVYHLDPGCSHELMVAFLEMLHRTHSALDAKYENIPADSPCLPAFESAGYIEIFRRIEMKLALD
ncbi:MAG: GNAT family N-acetyltransferase [Anaerolineae bacterium]|nr:GNAT family N-acetyltransferase [Anaerolineae bacterium]MCA9908858.1 GNAT family N-acetyltransferase [Anaerolineae bacterium]